MAKELDCSMTTGGTTTIAGELESVVRELLDRSMEVELIRDWSMEVELINDWSVEVELIGVELGIGCSMEVELYCGVTAVGKLVATGKKNKNIKVIMMNICLL